jgi:spermidine synthase
VYLREHPEEYEAILIDAFADATMPWHLVTREAAETYRAALKQRQGVVILNFIASLQGERARDFDNVRATFSEVFETIKLFYVNANDPNLVQNYILVASTKEAATSGGVRAGLWRREVAGAGGASGAVVLTDDKAAYDLD